MPGWDGPTFEKMQKTSGSGLLRSTTGKPEGPYQDMQPNERLGAKHYKTPINHAQNGVNDLLTNRGETPRITKQAGRKCC